MKILKKFEIGLIWALFLMGLSAFGANTGGVSFTPSSLELPVWSITLKGSSGTSDVSIYHCTGSSDSQCYVDVATQSQLDSLASKGTTSITAGTYSSIDISYCQNSSGSTNYTYQMKGSVTSGASTYYTATQTNGYLTTTQANNDYISFSTPGCSQEYKFPSPITISSGSTASVTLFTTLVNLAWGTNALTTYSAVGSYYAGYNSSNCVTSGSSAICSNSAVIVPYFGTGTPTVQYYTFADSSNSNVVGAQIMALVDSTGALIGVFPGRVFATTAAGPFSFGQTGGFDSQVTTISKNTDGSYVIANSTDGTANTTSNGFYLPKFQLLSAVNATTTGTGTVLTNSVSYTETRTK